MLGRRQRGGTQFVVQLSLLATALSVMVMILAEGILVGFKQSVGNKVYAFWGHLRTEALTKEADYFAQGAGLRDSLGQIADFLTQSPEIKSFRAYASKYGVLLSAKTLDGVMFKGYQHSQKQENLTNFLEYGHWAEPQSKELVLSQLQARELGLDTGQYVVANFVSQENLNRKRKLKVVGIYKTGIEMYDKNFAFVSLDLIQQLNHWDKEQFSGYEIILKNRKQVSSFADKLFEIIPENWQVNNTQEMFPSIFDWLELLDVNQYIVIIIMFIVAVLNMATSVITVVMDRARMIAILKTLGAGKRGIRRIFSYYAAFIALSGILLGNLLGLGLGFLQNHYQLVQLNPASYFIQSLYIVFNPTHILLLNLIIFILCYLVLILPSQLVYRQQVLKVLRF